MVNSAPLGSARQISSNLRAGSAIALLLCSFRVLIRTPTRSMSVVVTRIFDPDLEQQVAQDRQSLTPLDDVICLLGAPVIMILSRS